MKKTSYILLGFYLFLSCKVKEEIAPVLPTLKSFTVENNVSNSITKTDYKLIYNDAELSNLQKTDAIEKDGVLKIHPTINNFITYGLYSSYKIVSDVENSFNTNKMIYNAEKVNGEFNITVYFGKNFQTLSVLERNTKNQVSKYENVKPIVIPANGNEIYKLPNTYVRYEYNDKGNIIRIFQKTDGLTSEFLTNEYTYDSNPNPKKILVWVYRLLSDGVDLASSESNNNILTSKNYSQGVLFSETSSNYIYNATNKLPQTVTTTTKSYTPNTIIGITQTTYKY